MHLACGREDALYAGRGGTRIHEYLEGSVDPTRYRMRLTRVNFNGSPKYLVNGDSWLGGSLLASVSSEIALTSSAGRVGRLLVLLPCLVLIKVTALLKFTALNCYFKSGKAQARSTD